MRGTAAACLLRVYLWPKLSMVWHGMQIPSAVARLVGPPQVPRRCSTNIHRCALLRVGIAAVRAGVSAVELRQARLTVLCARHTGWRLDLEPEQAAISGAGISTTLDALKKSMLGTARAEHRRHLVRVWGGAACDATPEARGMQGRFVCRWGGNSAGRPRSGILLGHSYPAPPYSLHAAVLYNRFWLSHIELA